MPAHSTMESAAIPVALVRMIQDGPLQVRAEIPARERAKVFVGQSAAVTVEGAVTTGA